MQDEQLVKKSISGDMIAFRELISRHERLVTHMIARLIPRQEDLEDVRQEVFIKLYRHLPKFRFDCRLSTWVGRIAYTTALTHIRKKTGRPVSLEVGLAEEPAATDKADQLLQEKDEAAFLQKQISRLPLAYRTVLTLYHLNEFSYQEIEAITGMPEGTVKNYLFRARKLLRESLEKFINKSHERTTR